MEDSAADAGFPSSPSRSAEQMSRPVEVGGFAPSLPPGDFFFFWRFLPGGEVAVVPTLHEPGCPGGSAGAQNRGTTETLPQRAPNRTTHQVNINV